MLYHGLSGRLQGQNEGPRFLEDFMPNRLVALAQAVYARHDLVQELGHCVEVGRFGGEAWVDLAF